MANHITNYTAVDSEMGSLNILQNQKPSDYGTYFKRGLKFRANDNFLGGAEFIVIPIYAANTAGATISTITSAADVVTITTSGSHSLSVGARVLLSGQVPDKYVGDYFVDTVVSATVFTVKNALYQTIVAATTVGTYVSSPISRGQAVEISNSISSNVLRLSVAAWAGTAGLGLPLGIAYTSVLSGELALIQVSGLCQAISAGTPAVNDSVYYGAAAGKVRPTANAGAQVLGARYASTVAASGLLSEIQQSYFRGAAFQTVYDPQITFACDSDKALVFINQPHGQSAIL